jgi:hypothetical protein
MTASLIHVVTAAVVCALALAIPAAAEPNPPATETKPIKLKSFMRKPVATSATRTVKQTNGDYTKVAVKRRAKTRGAAVTQPPRPAETLSPAAAQAFAAYELARVRVVTPEEADGARRLADAAMNATTLVSVETVQIVSADEVNDLDRRADSPVAISLDSLSRDLAGSRSLTVPAEPKADADSWLQRLLVVFGSAFTAVAALVRTLLG